MSQHPLAENKVMCFQSIILKTQWILKDARIFKNLENCYNSFLLGLCFFLTNQWFYWIMTFQLLFNIKKQWESTLHFTVCSYREMRAASAATRIIYIGYSMERSFIIPRETQSKVAKVTFCVIWILSIYSLCKYFSSPRSTACMQNNKKQQK